MAQETECNLWDYNGIHCITTNGTVKKDGTCVMGRGNALEAKRLFPGIDKILGQKLKEGGNVPHILIDEPYNHGEPGHRTPRVVSFPVKHEWYEKADIDLIAQSAEKLKELLKSNPYRLVAIPRPGCGNGGLKWADVKPVIDRILDNYFVILRKKGEK